jgi:hypothetical protein
MTIEVKPDYRHGKGGKKSRQYSASREYQVFVTAPEDYNGLELRISDHPDLPQIGSAISVDYPNVLVTSVDPSEAVAGDWTKWLVTVNYETRAANVRDPIDPSVDPTKLPAITNSYSKPRNEAMEFAYQDGDIEGFPTKAVVNTEGDPFDPPLQREVSNQMLTSQRNLRNFDKSLIQQFENTINNVQLRFIGVNIPRFCGFISKISSQSAIDPKGKKYFIVTHEIEVSETPFKKRLVNSGFNKRVTSGTAGQKEPITFGDVNPNSINPDKEIDVEQRLDDNGAVIVDPLTPSHILEFDGYFAKSFTPLSLVKEE